MQNPEHDPFLIENDGGRHWQVRARSDQGTERQIKAIKVKNKKESTITVTAKVLNFTQLACT